MSVVVLDGETVDFVGDVPTNPEQVRVLLQQALGNGGRSLVAFSVDGMDLTNRQADENATYQRIEARSVSFESIIAGLVRSRLETDAELAEELDSTAVSVLSRPWKEAMPGVIELVQRFEPLLRECESVELFGRERGLAWRDGLADSFRRLTTGIDAVITSIQKGAVASVSDCIALRLAPELRSLLGLLRNDVLPELANGSSAKASA